MEGKYLGKSDKFIVTGAQWTTGYLAERMEAVWSSNAGNIANISVWTLFCRHRGSSKIFLIEDRSAKTKFGFEIYLWQNTESKLDRMETTRPQRKVRKLL